MSGVHDFFCPSFILGRGRENNRINTAMRLILPALTIFALAPKAHAFDAPVLRGSAEVRFLCALLSRRSSFGG